MRRSAYILLAAVLSSVLALPGVFHARALAQLDEPSLAHSWSTDAGRLPDEGATARSAHPSDVWQLPSYAEIFDDDDDDDAGFHPGTGTGAPCAHADDGGGNQDRLSALRRSLLALAPKTSPPVA